MDHLSFQMKKSTSGNFIRPWPCIRYKARGGLVSETRPWPYNRGNTVLPVQIAQYFSVRNFESNRYSLRSREGRNPEIHQRTSAGDKYIQKRGRNIWQNIQNEIE